jgi:membrane protease YdiL (CAAX protease family)
MSRAARAGIAGFLLITPIVAAVSIAINALLTLVGLPRAPEASHATLALLAERRDPLLTALTLAHVTLLVPVAEEFVWRGMMQPGLRALMGVKAGIALTALLFTLIHVSAIATDGLPAGLAMLAVLAVGLGILRERTGSVLAPIIVHALFNAFNVAITLMKNPAGSPAG